MFKRASDPRPCVTAATLLLAAVAGQAGAVDGVILINQARALAGRGIPGDAAGFPVTLTRPGSYRLASNLSVPDANTTAVKITAQDVTLDLNGFMITNVGPHVIGTGFGVDGATSLNVAVLNGTVRWMGAGGINLGHLARVERVQSIQNLGWHCIAVGSNSTVSGNIVNGCNGGGIVAGEASLVTHNTVRFNGDSGIDAATDSTVTGNIANNNRDVGIAVDCPGLVTGNTMLRNAEGDFFQMNPATCISNTNVFTTFSSAP